jgi:hypothetical protein
LKIRNWALEPPPAASTSDATASVPSAPRPAIANELPAVPAGGMTAKAFPWGRPEASNRWAVNPKSVKGRLNRVAEPHNITNSPLGR